MAKNTCKLCSRRFASPRALAGHMRAHSIAAAKSQISSASTSIAAGGGGGGGVDDDADAKKPSPIQGHALREKPKRRARLAESDFSDRESETTDYYSPDDKRSHDGSGDAEPVSSVSDGDTPVEDVALSLMMLSRDSWPTPPSPSPPPPAYYSYYRADSDDEAHAARRPTVAPAAAAAQKRTRYECPACKKVFRSYQALGGHRASNVRGGRGGCCAPPLGTPPPPAPLQPLPECDDGGEEDPTRAQPHECPNCLRVFPSGQALGGHKRSHLCSGAAAAAAAASPGADPASVATKSLGFIDLNLPAPFDDVEHSAVSDPFLSSKPAGS